MQRAGLERRRVLDPRRHVLGVVGQHARRRRSRGCRSGSGSGPIAPADTPRDGVTAHARVAGEELAGPAARVDPSRLRRPAPSALATQASNASGLRRSRGCACWRARCRRTRRTGPSTRRAVGRERDAVHAARDDVALAAELRDPEAVDDVGRRRGRARPAVRPAGAARWRSRLRVRDSGTPTTTAGPHTVDPERGRRRRLLGPEDHLDRRDRDDQQDHARRDRPRDLEQRVAVDLAREAATRAFAEAPQDPARARRTPSVPMIAEAHVMMPYTERVERARSERAATVDIGPSHAHPPSSATTAARARRPLPARLGRSSRRDGTARFQGLRKRRASRGAAA